MPIERFKSWTEVLSVVVTERSKSSGLMKGWVLFLDMTGAKIDGWGNVTRRH